MTGAVADFAPRSCYIVININHKPSRIGLPLHSVEMLNYCVFVIPRDGFIY